MEAITKPQIRAIWALARHLGMDSDQVHALVQEVTGSDSVSALNKAGAIRVIDAMKAKAGKVRPQDRVSQNQAWLIEELVRQLGWSDNPKRLQGFMKRVVGVDHIQWLTPDQSRKVVEGLKAILKRQGGGAHAAVGVDR